MAPGGRAAGAGRDRAAAWVRGFVVAQLAVAAAAAPLALGGARPWIVAPLLAWCAFPLVVWALASLFLRVPLRGNPWLHLPIALLCAWFLGRYLTTPVEYSARYALMTSLLGLVALALSASWMDRSGAFRTLLWVWGLSCVAVAVYGLWQAWTGANVVYTIERASQYRGRASGTFVNANHLAGWLELTAPWLIVAGTRPGIRLAARVAPVAAAGVAALGHLFTQSRGGWLAAAAEAGAFTWFRTPRGRRRAVAVLVFAVVLAAAVLLVIALSPAVRDRFLESRPDSDTSFQLRVYMWTVALRLFTANPWCGVGLGMYEWEFVPFRKAGYQFWTPYAHNDYLQWLAEHGVLGLVFLVLLVIGLARLLRRARRAVRDPWDEAVAVGVRIILIGVAVHSLVDFNLHIPANLLTLCLGLGLAAARAPVRLVLPRLPGRLLIAVAAVAGWAALAVVAVRTTSAAWDHARARALYGDFEYAAALDRVEASLRRDSSNYWVCDLAGDVLGRQAQWDISIRTDPARREAAFGRALSAHAAAAALCPYDPLHEQKQAGILKVMGCIDEAEDRYRDLVDRFPEDPSNYGLLGNLLLASGREDEAERLYLRALECLPNDELAVRQLNAIRRRRRGQSR